MPVNTTIKIRKGTQSEWQSSNPILASGEPGFVIDTNRFKIGDGSTSWNSLNYAAIVPSGFIAGSGINIGLGTNGSTATISVSGLNSSYLSDFNSAVSGLLPVKNIIAGTGISVSSSNQIYTINSTGAGVLADQAKSLVTTVFNKTGSVIPKMTAVYISGGQGDLPAVGLAIATSDMTSAGTYGLTYESISNMNSGKVIVFGALSGLNTDQFNPNAPTGDVNGSILYLSPTTSGALTRTKPSAPNHIVTIGTIVRTHQNEGVIEVRVQNGFELEELHNVAATGASNNQAIIYNSASGLWMNTTLTSSLISDFNEAVDDRVGSGLFVAGTGINLNYNDGSNSFSVSVTGLINNPTNNRILTSRDNTTTGIDAESNLTFDGTTLICSGNARIGDGQYIYVHDGLVWIKNTDGSLIINCEESLLHDANGSVISLDFNGRYLYDSAQAIVLSWYEPGKIGIRNTSPSYTLDVNGSGNFASGLAIANQTANTIASFDGSKNVVSLSTGTYPSLTELSYVKGVTSAIQTQINSKQNTLTNPVTGTGVANHIAYWNSSSGIVADSGQLYWDSSNNRLGIGTSSPSVILDVAGPIKSSGLAVWQSQNNVSALDIKSSGGTYTHKIYANSAGYSLMIESPHSIQYSGAASGGSHQFVLGSEAWRMTKDTFAPGVASASASGGIYAPIDGFLGFGTIGSTNLYKTFAINNRVGDNYGVKLLYTTGGNLTDGLVLDNTGKIGIGTSSPSYNLHVIGTGNFSQNLLVNGTPVSVSGHTHTVSDITNFNSSVSGLLPSNIVTGTGVVNHVAYWNSSSGIVADSGQLYWDSTNNRLGIGTSSPGYSLDVVGDAEFGANGSVKLIDTGGGNARMVFTGAGSVDCGTNFTFRNNAGTVEYARIDTAGRVGIGTNSPTSSLTVSGIIQLTDTAGNRVQFFRGGGTQYDYSIAKEGNHLAVSTANDGSTFRYTQFGYHSGSTWTPKTVINNYNGNIGIGTSSPTVALHAIGSGIFTSGVQVGDSSSNAYLIGPSGNTYIRFNNGAFNWIELASNTYSGSSTYLSTQYSYLNSAATYVNGTFQFPKAGNVPTSTATQRDSNSIIMYNRLWNGSAESAPGNEILSKASTSVNLRSRFSFLMQNEDGTSNRTERFSILSNGYIGVGNTAPSYSLDVVGTGNFSQNLLVNGTGVSLVGHTHTSSDITNFNASVSGLLPTISNSGDNRILTSTGSSTGINAESNATFDGTTFAVSGAITVDNLKLDGNTLSSTNSNGNIVIRPSGTGALQRDGGGNARGQYAIDWQTVRAISSQVAGGNYSVIGGGQSNTASSNYSTVGGGYSNTANGYISTVGGGRSNTASASGSTVGGGRSNTSSASYSTVGGGYNNTASGSRSTVGGGQTNTASGYKSTISGGDTNTASGTYGNNYGTFGHQFIGGGKSNDVTAYFGTIGGGEDNTVSGYINEQYAPVRGHGAICGGKNNTVSGIYGYIGGGQSNTVSANYSGGTDKGHGTIGGGKNNTVSIYGYYGTVGGGLNNTASGYISTVGGGNGNTSSGNHSTVGGGQSNTASSNYSTVSGGLSNTASGGRSTVGGGHNNTASATYSTVGGGKSNTASVIFSTVGGGYNNNASDSYSTVGGGRSNTSSASYSTVGGGFGNTSIGYYSTVPGGMRAKATRHGELSHAAGYFASIGDAQHTILVARRTTTNATANQVLFLDNSVSRLTLPAKTTWTFSIKLSAYNDTDSEGAWWIFRGGVRRNAANGTALIGSLITESGVESSLSTASASVVADDTNEALEIRVTGVTSKNIRWVAVIDISQVSYGTP